MLRCDKNEFLKGFLCCNGRGGFSRNHNGLGARLVNLALVVLSVFLFIFSLLPRYANAEGVTVITHGYKGSMAWVNSMANEIAKRAGGKAIIYTLKIEGATGYPKITSFKRDAFQPSPTYLSNLSAAEVIVQVDWTSLSGGAPMNTDTINCVGFTPTGGIARQILEALVDSQFIVTDGSLDYPLVELPIHLIGHSRGASVMSDVAGLLGVRGVWVDQQTTLDPHPVLGCFDSPVHVYENVLFADNYYQSGGSFTGVPDYPAGKQIDGAYNRKIASNLLTGFYGGYNFDPAAPFRIKSLLPTNMWVPHTNIHLWYNGTIDTVLNAHDGEAHLLYSSEDFSSRNYWWDASEAQGAIAGFYYSRIVGGNRTSSGYNNIASGLNQASLPNYSSGTSNRIPLIYLVREENNVVVSYDWASLISVTKRPSSSASGTIGQTFTVDYQYQSLGSQSVRVELFLDADENPYNSSNTLLSCIDTDTQGSMVYGSTGNVVMKKSATCNLSGVAGGTYHIAVRIKAPTQTILSGTRYLYAGETIAVSSAANGGGSTTLPQPTLIGPSNGVQGQSVMPLFLWNAVAGATSGYRLLVATSLAALPTDPSVSACSGCVLNELTTDTSFIPASGLLNPNATYYWQVHARGNYYGQWSEQRSFTTAPVASIPAPAVDTLEATGVSDTGATLNGSVNPGGIPTTAWFEYGTNSSLSSASVTVARAVTAGSVSAAFSHTFFTILNPGTTYYYRIVASSAGGVVKGPITSFTANTVVASVAPTTWTSGASAITHTSAYLNGTVTFNGAVSANVWFEWGTTSNLASFSSTTTSMATLQNYNVKEYLNNVLAPSTTYYYRLVASNEGGITKSAIASFTTPLLVTPPDVTNGAVVVDDMTAITANPIYYGFNGYVGATVEGNVDPKTSPTTAWLELGTSPDLAGLITSSRSTYFDYPATFAYHLNNLCPNTTYYYRTAATNAVGTQRAGVSSFTTTFSPISSWDISFAKARNATATSAVIYSDNEILYGNTGFLFLFQGNVWFEWGTDPAMATFNTTASSIAWNKSENISGLVPGVTYYYRWAGGRTECGKNGVAQRGPIQSFQTTDAIPPASVALAVPTTVSDKTVTLSWNAPGDDGNTGAATSYDIRYASSAISDGNWQSATRVISKPTPLVAGTQQTLEVTGLSCGTTYYFALKSTDEAGNVSLISNSPSATTLSIPCATSSISGLQQQLVATLGTDVISTPISVNSISTPVAINIVGGEYSIDNAPFTSVGGLVSNGQIVRIRQKSAMFFGTESRATLTIDGASTVFVVRTAHPVSVGHSSADSRSHSMVLKSDGTVWAWGNNDFGQIGDGSLAAPNRLFPVQVMGTSPGKYYSFYYNGGRDNSALSGVIDVSAGISHNLALRSDGSVWSWGENFSGQRGDPVQENRAVALPISGLNNVIAVAAGQTHSLALISDGTVWAWGGNSNGQLGYDTKNFGSTASNTPKQVAGLNEVIAICAGDYSSVALKIDGTVAVWGAALGVNNSFVVTPMATPVNGLTDVRSIACGRSHILALKSNGTVWNWTWGAWPVMVAGLDNVSSVSAGNGYSMAIRSDGSLWMWGWNGYGNIGNAPNYDVPTLIMTGVVAVTGYQHTLALKADGSLWSWGLNASGQLGHDQTTLKSVPGLVTDFGSTAFTSNDTVPNSFSFAARQLVPINSVQVSDTITVTGVNIPVPISITGGEYSIGGSAFTNTAGNVTNSQNVVVRLTSASAYSTPTSATLTIGGVSATFTVITIPSASSNVSQSDVIIVSSGSSSGGSWIGNTWIPSATGSTVLASEIVAHLALGATVVSSTGVGNGDIVVSDALAWTTNTTLTLAAVRDIKINANINATGDTAGLVLGYGTGRSYMLTNDASITLSGATPTLKMGVPGSEVSYTVINSLGMAGDISGTTLQGMSGNLAGHYALGSNIDATPTSSWNAGAGFARVGNNVSQFNGSFDGLGHTISNLVINRPATDYVGLFGYTAAGSVVRNVGLVGGSVIGNAYVGELIGQNWGNVSKSYTTGNVGGSAGSFQNKSLGGLVGINFGSVSTSYASGSVSGGVNSISTGGLAGSNAGAISNSYATGNVSGNSEVGGLAGYNSGIVSTSYSTGSVSSVSGATNVQVMGGLVGYNNNGIISASYTTGSVSGASYVGGFVGYNNGIISASYATGSVIGSSYRSGYHIGGLVGANGTGTVTSSYWDTHTSWHSNWVGGTTGDLYAWGVMKGIGGTTNLTGATGLTSDQMIMQSSFAGFDFTNNWWMSEGNTLPLLRSGTTLLGFSPTSLSFGSQSIGVVSAAQIVTLANTGTETLNITSITASGDYAQTATCETTLEAGASCAISVTYAPTVAGPQSGSLSIISNAAGNPHVINLSGAGVAVPDAPTAISATPGNTQVTVSFSEPANIGSSSITGYTVTSSPAGGLDTNAGTTALTHTITGLVNGTAYTFTVTATNIVGVSAASAASNSVTPMASQAIDTISFSPSMLTVGGTTTASATATSGLAVSFSSTTPSICTASGSTVTGIAAGICTLAADQAGNTNYNAATRVMKDIAVSVLAISPITLPNGAVGSAYSQMLVIIGGTAPYVWSSSSLPAGLSLNASTGVISGTPTTEGLGVFTVSVTDATGATSTSTLSVNVIAAPVDTGNVTIIASGSSSGGSWVGNTWMPNTTGSTVLASEIMDHLALGTTVINTAVSGDIIVNGAVGWSASNTLVLSSIRDIKVNANLSAMGNTAGLVLRYGTGRSYTLANGANITLSGATPSLKIGVVGSETTYTVINSLGVAGDASTSTLQGMKNNLTGNYALGSNIDATATSSWNTGAGFEPVGNGWAISLKGSFDGLGHTISNLVINRPTVGFVGLFGCVGSGGIVRNVGLLGGSVVGLGAGSLVGVNSAGGTIRASYATGSVSGSGGAGGLVGSNRGVISTSYAIGNVSGGGAAVGGLVGGAGPAGYVEYSYATGNVSGGSSVGGLVGSAYYSGIHNSYATGSVSGTSSIGGLLGRSQEGTQVSYSYAAGSVSGSSFVGGLVGNNNVNQVGTSNGTVSNSYWDTQTSGQLVGIGSAATTGATATGLPTEQMKTMSSFSGFDFTNIWYMIEGNTRPLVRASPLSYSTFLSYSAEPGYGTTGVSPATGTVNTTYSYKVVYLHAGNAPPSAILVCIDAVACRAMNVDTSAAAALHDGNYANGEQYIYSTTLAAGAHTYFFAASDGTNNVALPALNSLIGPTVLGISTTTLTDAAAFSVYSTTIMPSGGTAPYTFSASGLPAGMSLNTTTGVISGTLTTSGAQIFSVSVTDVTGVSITKVFSINVTVATNTAPSFGIGDGKVTTDMGAGDYEGRSIAVQSDGKILVAGGSGVARYNTDGSLDISFGLNGKVTNLFGYGYSIAVQTDGKILVAGTSPNGLDFAIARYNTDGSSDTSFDGDGKVTTDFGANFDRGYSITVQTDDKILVAGESYTGSKWNLAIARYNTDGSLDASFDTDGKVTTAFSAYGDSGRRVTVQSDGKILVAGINGWGGIGLARYNADGSLDTSFDGDGMVTTTFGVGGSSYGYGVTVQADGKILVAGAHSNGWNFAIARYNTDGSLDISFDGDGTAVTDFGGTDIGYSVTVQADGKILVGGGGNGSFALARYNTGGSLDTSFDGDGKVTTNFGLTAQGYSVTVQLDGKILVAGGSWNNLNGVGGNFALARYNTDGSLDTRFHLTNTLNGTPSFTEGGAAVVLDTDVQITDVELAAIGNYAGASLTLARNGGANAQDVFSNTGTLGTLTEGGDLTVGGTAIGTVTTNSGGTLTLTFNGSATQSLVNSAMQQIAYSNSSNAPSFFAQIDWAFSDGNSGAQGTGGVLTVTGSTTVNIIGKAAPAIIWSAPATITYGTALSATQLNATANVAGSFAYTPALGTVLGVGTHTLSVTFTPTDVVNYSSSTATVNLTVNKATLTATANNASKTYGAANPALGVSYSGFVNGDTASVVTTAPTVSTTATTISAVGTYPITASGAAAANYTFNYVAGALTVGAASTTVTWSVPAAITYGTALSATQLNATANIAGGFVYTPALGTVLGAGNQTLSVIFTPTDTANYSSSTATVNLSVNKASQAISGFTVPTVTMGGSGAITATGGASTNPVVLTSQTTGICTVNGSTVNGVTAGICTIAADQASDANYNAAPQITQSITVGSAPGSVLSLVPSWNLVGNSTNAPLDVATAFGDTTKVQTVWKWTPTGSMPGLTYPTWAFYAPSLTAPNLATYAASKNYEVLSAISGGEGFWVNAKAAFTVPLPAGTAIGTSYFLDQLDPAQNKLLKGWNLIATGDAITPSAFNLGLSVTPPAVGAIPINITTLWAWDSTLMNWYFYAPSLEASGGLVNYITGKNYLDFTQHNKTLGQGVGFWVNKP